MLSTRPAIIYKILPLLFYFLMWYPLPGLFSAIQTSQRKWFYSLQREQEVKHSFLHLFSRKIVCSKGILLLIMEWYFLEVLPRVPGCGRFCRTSLTKIPSSEKSEFRLSQGTTIGGKWTAFEWQWQWHTSFGPTGVTSFLTQRYSMYSLGHIPIHVHKIPIFQKKAVNQNYPPDAAMVYRVFCHTHHWIIPLFQVMHVLSRWQYFFQIKTTPFSDFFDSVSKMIVWLFFRRFSLSSIPHTATALTLECKSNWKSNSVWFWKGWAKCCHLK